MIAAVQMAGFIALLALLAGCVLLHARLRNLASTSFLLSIVGIAAWIFWIQDALQGALPISAPATAGNSGHGTNAADAIATIVNYQTVPAACESLLMLWFGISFFLAARSIASQRASR